MGFTKVFRSVFRLVKYTLIAGGVFFFIVIALAFTFLPYAVQHWLASGIESHQCEPAAIVMFGAAGLPGGENMVRLYHVAAAHTRYPSLPIYICLPGNPENDHSTLQKIRRELTMRQVADTLIRFVHQGKNTRAQVVELASIENKALLHRCIVVVTSPVHMRRSLLSLRKAGFRCLVALPAFEAPFESELRFDMPKADDHQNFTSYPFTQSLTLRYSFWGRLKHIIESARELTALTYYWLWGWI